MATVQELERLREGIQQYFAEFPFFRLMGMTLDSIEPGRAVLGMSHRHDLLQPAGILHGGAIASLVDTCIAHAILMTDPYLEAQAQGGHMVSVDLRIKYFRPISSGRVQCVSTIPRLGKRIVHAESIVTDEQNREVARGDSIYMILGSNHLQKPKH